MASATDFTSYPKGARSFGGPVKKDNGDDFNKILAYTATHIGVVPPAAGATLTTNFVIPFPYNDPSELEAIFTSSQQAVGNCAPVRLVTSFTPEGNGMAQQTFNLSIGTQTVQVCYQVATKSILVRVIASAGSSNQLNTSGILTVTRRKRKVRSVNKFSFANTTAKIPTAIVNPQKTWLNIMDDAIVGNNGGAFIDMFIGAADYNLNYWEGHMNTSGSTTPSMVAVRNADTVEVTANVVASFFIMEFY
jgi:hypothetical protein